jgi:hypothetical protein
MTSALVLIVAVVAIVVVGILLATGRSDAAWKRLATDIGAEFIKGGLLRSSKVQAQVKQRTVTLDTYSVPHGKSSSTYTRLSSPLQNKDGFQFTVSREGLMGKLGKALGSQDVEIGISDFDGDFLVQGNNENKLRALLADAKIRELIQGQRSIRLGLKGDELHFQAPGVIRDVPRLKSLFELFSALLDQLEA